MATKKAKGSSLHPSDRLHNAIVDVLSRSGMSRDEKRDTLQQLVGHLGVYKKHWLGNG